MAIIFARENEEHKQRMKTGQYRFAPAARAGQSRLLVLLHETAW
jgi:hypothetical protein